MIFISPPNIYWKKNQSQTFVESACIWTICVEWRIQSCVSKLSPLYSHCTREQHLNVLERHLQATPRCSAHALYMPCRYSTGEHSLNFLEGHLHVIPRCPQMPRRCSIGASLEKRQIFCTFMPSLSPSHASCTMTTTEMIGQSFKKPSDVWRPTRISFNL